MFFFCLLFIALHTYGIILINHSFFICFYIHLFKIEEFFYNQKDTDKKNLIPIQTRTKRILFQFYQHPGRYNSVYVSIREQMVFTTLLHDDAYGNKEGRDDGFGKSGVGLQQGAWNFEIGGGCILAIFQYSKLKFDMVLNFGLIN